MVILYCEKLLAHRPTPKLEYHPLGDRSSIRTHRTRHVAVTLAHLSRSAEGYVMRALMICILTKCSDDYIKENEIGGACSMDGRGERCVQGFGGET